MILKHRSLLECLKSMEEKFQIIERGQGFRTYGDDDFRITDEFNSEKDRVNIFSLEKISCIYVGFYFFQLKEETNRDYSFPAGLEDHILGENISPNTSISGLVPSELTQSNTSLGSSSSSGDIGKLHYSPGKGEDCPLS